jgi:hypothetical protein
MYIYIRACVRAGYLLPLLLALALCADDIEWCRVKEHRPSAGRISSAPAVCIQARVFCEHRLPQEGNKKLRLSLSLNLLTKSFGLCTHHTLARITSGT